MTTLVIKALEENRELDKQAMANIVGGNLGGYSGWIGSLYGPNPLASNFNFGGLFSTMNVSQILGYTDRFTGRMLNNPFYFKSPGTALRMYKAWFHKSASCQVEGSTGCS
ncbi:MAG: hypothetical protein ACREXX_04745 [Gammaproteobacteria bacterium]